MTKNTSEKPQPSAARQQIEQLLQQHTKEAYLRRLAKIGVIIKPNKTDPKL